MTAADYRAEARAWRLRAQCWGRSSEWPNSRLVTNSMAERTISHWNASPSDLWKGYTVSDHMNRCLILALEAEDDARRAER